MLQCRVFWFGRIPRKFTSAEQAARSANIYSARVLLRGSVEDGNETIKPVGERLAIASKVVELFDLQPAVEQGLLSVL
jgi:hypothetical protein